MKGIVDTEGTSAKGRYIGMGGAGENMASPEKK